MNERQTQVQLKVERLGLALPLALLIAVLIYQLGIARWVHMQLGEELHYISEIAFFGTVGPIVTYWALQKTSSWFAEAETAKEKMKAYEQKLASITSMSADAIIGLEADGSIESWNLGAEMIFGYHESEVVGRSLSLFFGQEDKADIEAGWLFSAVEDTGFVRGYEADCRNSNGDNVSVELTATKMATPDNARIGYSVIMRDITKRKLREKEILRLNESLNKQVEERTALLEEKIDQLAFANQELNQLEERRSELVSLVSHQIRAPLTNVQGAVEKMRTDCANLSPTCQSMISILQDQVKRLDRLVQDVLDTGRVEAGDISVNAEPISLIALARQVAEEFNARSRTLQIDLVEKPGIPLALADKHWVTEILVNLLDNAEKYSARTGRITVDVHADQEEVAMSIRDHGPGIPEREMDKLFDKFYRLDNSDSQPGYGYGLGLYLCRLLAEAQEGSITAENHPSGGAVFTVSFPQWME